MKIQAICLLLLLAACTSGVEKMKMNTDDLLKRANQAVLSGQEKDVIDSAYSAVESFASEFPEDTLTPYYLFEKALLQEKQRDYQSSISTLDRIYSLYPASPQGSKALFLQGYLFANVLNDYDQARIKYQLYLDNYSGVDEKITSDVKMELKNLGKTPDEILKEILEKSAVDTTAMPV